MKCNSLFALVVLVIQCSLLYLVLPVDPVVLSKGCSVLKHLLIEG